MDIGGAYLYFFLLTGPSLMHGVHSIYIRVLSYWEIIRYYPLYAEVASPHNDRSMGTFYNFKFSSILMKLNKRLLYR